MATSPLPSWVPTCGRKCYITSTYWGVTKQKTKSEVAASPLPSRGPTCGQKCYVTPAFSGVPKQGHKSEVAASPLASQGATSPLRSRRSPNKGRRSEMAASPVPCRGPTSGRKCYITPAFLGVPKHGDDIRSGYLTLAFSGAQKWAEVLRKPCILVGPQTRGPNQKWLPHPRPLKGLTSGRKCWVAPEFSGVPKQRGKIGNGYLSHAFSGAHKWAEVLRNPYILGGPQTRGPNQKWLPHPCLLAGLTRGQNSYITLHSRGSPNKGTK